MNEKRIAVVTGASSGMGKDFATQLFEQNLNPKKNSFTFDQLWLFARRADRLEKLKSELDALSAAAGKSVEVKCFCTDLTGIEGSDSFKKILDSQALENSFTISVLVNNAGYGTYGTFENTELDRQLKMIEVNCTALTGICGHSLKYLKKGSCIINVASLAAFMALGNFAVYGATKAYVYSFTQALAAELYDKGIRVTALCPGSVSTEFANVASKGVRKEVLHGVPSEKVVAHCLKKAQKGCHTALMRPKWKFSAFICRFITHYFGARMTFLFHKRPSNP